MGKYVGKSFPFKIPLVYIVLDRETYNVHTFHAKFIDIQTENRTEDLDILLSGKVRSFRYSQNKTKYIFEICDID